MNVKKSLIIGGSALAITLSTIGVAAAATDTKPTTIVDEISEKFHLKKSDVQAVFDKHKDEHKADRQQKVTERLDEAVASGKITAAQKDQILAKQKELKAFMETLKDKLPEERHEAMEAKMEEFRQWAKDNDIAVGQLIGPGAHGRGMRGMHGPQ